MKYKKSENNKKDILNFLDILKEGRRQIIYNAQFDNSVELSDAIYSKYGSETATIKLDYYELICFNIYLKLIEDFITNSTISHSQKKSILDKYAELFMQLKESKNTEKYGIYFFKGTIENFRKIIQQNESWEKQLKFIKVCFEKDKKQLEIKIRKMEEENGHS